MGTSQKKLTRPRFLMRFYILFNSLCQYFRHGHIHLQAGDGKLFFVAFESGRNVRMTNILINLLSRSLVQFDYYVNYNQSHI